jgi:radical SAM superfamily enzyme YgiQ (UPF0313 family)
MNHDAGYDVLVLTPFRRPTFRLAISADYPVDEPWDSPAYLAAGAVEAAGLRTTVLPLQIIFAGYSPEQDEQRLRDLLAAHPARIVLFATDHLIASRSTAAVYGIGICAQLIRGNAPDTLLGVTGRIATVLGTGLLDEVDALDFVVLGEAEEELGPLCVDLLRRGPAAVADDRGHLVARSGAGVPGTPLRIADPDTMPLPGYHHLRRGLQVYEQMRKAPVTTVPLSMRTSFGCRFQCKFCAGVPHWREYRTKSAPRFAAELDRALDALGDRAGLSFLEDEIFTLREDHVDGIGAVVSERGLRIGGVYTHASLLTPQMAERLAGFVGKVYLGLDNADDQLLRKMGKGQRLDTVLGAVDNARQAKLRTHLEWIIGSPEEDVSSLVASLGAIHQLLATHVVDSINTYVYCPHPGTEYARHAARYGLELIDGFDNMQESGGYPAAAPQELTRQQVFIAYLMSQLVITETTAAREHAAGTSIPAPPDLTALRALFTRIGVPDEKPRREVQS